MPRSSKRGHSVDGHRIHYNSSYRSSFTTLILLYGTMHIFVGTVLTLSDSLANDYSFTKAFTLNRRPYLEVFYMVDYGASIVGILILFVLSWVGERRNNRSSSLEDPERCNRASESYRRKSSSQQTAEALARVSTRIQHLLRCNRKHRRKRYHRRSSFLAHKHAHMEDHSDAGMNSVQSPMTVFTPLPLLPEERSLEEAALQEEPSSFSSASPPTQEATTATLATDNGNCVFASGSVSSSGTLPVLKQRKIPKEKRVEIKSQEDVFVLDRKEDLERLATPTGDETRLELPPQRASHDSSLSYYPILRTNSLSEYPRVQAVKKKVYRDKEGVNLYLRLGAVAFGFGVMIFDGFSMTDHLGGSAKHCHSNMWITKTTLHFLFVFLQTFYLFKNHRIVYNWHNGTVGFVLIHLATTNLLQWMKTVVFAVADQLSFDFQNSQQLPSSSHGDSAVHLAEDNSSVYATLAPLAHQSLHFLNSSLQADIHESSDSHQDLRMSCEGYAKKLEPYLFPCAVEYSLITMAICYKLYQKEGNAYHQQLQQNRPIFAMNNISRCSSISCLSTASAGFVNSSHNNSTSPTAGDALLSPATPKSPNPSFMAHMTKEQQKEILTRHAHLYSKCHHSNRGLFMGLIVILLTIVAIGLFFHLHHNSRNKEIAVIIYQATEIALQISSSLACVFGLYQQMSLTFRNLSEGEAFDINLLLLGFCGMFSYNMFLMLPVLLKWDERRQITERLYVVKSGMEIIETMLQVFFIIEASHRCAGTIENIRKKPGRSWVTFLLVCNLSMWIVNTFESRAVDEHHDLHRLFYSRLSWQIVNFISLPMIIFYRFHSTVCLSDIWIKCYKPDL